MTCEERIPRARPPQPIPSPRLCGGRAGWGEGLLGRERAFRSASLFPPPRPPPAKPGEGEETTQLAKKLEVNNNE